MPFLKIVVCCACFWMVFADKCSAEWNLLGLEGKSVLCVEVHPTKDSVIFAGTNEAGLFVSRDNGKTWEKLLENISIYAIVIDRNNPEIILIGREDGLSVSKNGGSRFKPFADIMYNGKVYPYAGTGCIAIDETPTQAIVVGIDGGLFKTFDFGKTWEPAGLSDYEMTSISIDNFGRKAVIYAGTAGDGVYKSANYGMTWNSINNGIDDPNINALLCDRKLHNILYAGSLGGGAYISTDYGDNWQMITMGLRSLSGYTLEQAVDIQTNRSVVYIGNYNGEVFKTEDGGNTFTKVGDKLKGKAVLCMSCSNVLPSSLYLGTSDGLYVMEQETQDNSRDEAEDSVQDVQ